MRRYAFAAAGVISLFCNGLAYYHIGNLLEAREARSVDFHDALYEASQCEETRSRMDSALLKVFVGSSQVCKLSGEVEWRECMGILGWDLGTALRNSSDSE